MFVRNGKSQGPDLVPWQELNDIEHLTAVDAGPTATQPRLIRFTAEWCLPCKQMEREVFSRQDVADAITARFAPLSVDLTHPSAKQDALATRFEIAYIPTLVVVAPNGVERSRISGGVDAQTLGQWLDRAAAE